MTAGGLGRSALAAAAFGFGYLSYMYLTLPDIRPLRSSNPTTTAFMEIRSEEARASGKKPRRVQQWVSYGRISPSLKRAVLVAEDAAFWQHEGVDYDELEESIRGRLGSWPARARGEHHHPTARQESVPVAVKKSVAESARIDHRETSGGGAQEGPHLRAVSERDRVGRRHLRLRGGCARLFLGALVITQSRSIRRCSRPPSSILGC